MEAVINYKLDIIFSNRVTENLPKVKCNDRNILTFDIFIISICLVCYVGASLTRATTKPKEESRSGIMCGVQIRMQINK